MSHTLLLAAAALIPERLPSLVMLVGFWIPPAMFGWMIADLQTRGYAFARGRDAWLALTGLVVLYVAAWFAVNVTHMPPYVPGAVADPTVATPEAAQWLATLTGLLILPGSAIACAWSYRLFSQVRQNSN